MILNPAVSRQLPLLAERFQRKEPFRHVVIEDFFTTDFCTQLLTEFPPFERGNARNEAGELGGKSCVEKIHGLGPPSVTIVVRSLEEKNPIH